jgi:hypothetical protein
LYANPKDAEATPAAPQTDTGRSNLAIIYRPIAELKLDPKNPRRHSPGQIKQIARSIRNFGFIVPVLIDANRKVISGHGRLMAAQHLGLSEVPIICVDHLSEALLGVRTVRWLSANRDVRCIATDAPS